VGCRICRHADRVAIEAFASTGGASLAASRFGISERSLERHLRNINETGVCAASSEASADEEAPPTSRSPVFGPASGVRVTIDVDDRAVASVVLDELESIRAQFVAGLETIDRLRTHWQAIARAA
jgi:hypothetical protein